MHVFISSEFISNEAVAISSRTAVCRFLNGGSFGYRCHRVVSGLGPVRSAGGVPGFGSGSLEPLELLPETRCTNVVRTN